MSANRTKTLVTKALEVEDREVCSPVCAFELAVEECTRLHGPFAPESVAFARKLYGAARRRVCREIVAAVADRYDASENMQRQAQGGRPGHA